MTKKNCKACGAEFSVTNLTKNKIYCSAKCRTQTKNNKVLKAGEKECLTCKKTFNGQLASYCSLPCKQIAIDKGKLKGRPSKYEEWMCEEAEEYLAGGRTKRALAGHLSIAPDTLYAWMEKHANLSNAIKIGMAKHEGVFCDKLNENLISKTTYGPNGKAELSQSMNTGIATLVAKHVLGWGAEEAKGSDFEFKISYDPKGLKE